MVRHPPSAQARRMRTVAANERSASPDRGVAGDRPRTGGVDTIRQYLQEIGRSPLLEPEEEADLFKRLAAGRALRASLVRSTPADHGRIGVILAEGAEARVRLVEANLRLVVSMAAKRGGDGQELLDRVQEGNVGLVRAVDRFDPARGYRFSTYATWWIAQAMDRGGTTAGGALRVPLRARRAYQELRAAELDLTHRLHRQPGRQELAAELGWAAEDVERAAHAGRTVSSLDDPLGPDSGSVVGEIVPDAGALDPADVVADRAVPQIVDGMLAVLEPLEREVIRSRLGSADGQAATLDEVAARMGISRETVRRLEASARRHLVPAAIEAGLEGGPRPANTPAAATIGRRPYRTRTSGRGPTRGSPAARRSAPPIPPTGPPSGSSLPDALAGRGPAAAPATRGPDSTGCLVVPGGDRAGEITVVLPVGVSTIGRRPISTVVLTDPCVSRLHARISTVHGLWLLEDLTSTAGTTVNGIRVRKPTRLRDGDRIELGRSRLVFRCCGRTGGAA
jgi:RNA polymerase primary sigma factor